MVGKCAGRNKDGSACGARPLPGQSACPWHSPGLAERRREWSAKGGRGKSNASRAKRQMPAAMTLDELRSVLSATIGGVLAGRVAPNVGNCVGSLARALADVTEAADLERRLGELEAAAASDRWRSGT